MQQLLGQISREPPAGFAKVSTQQVLRADRELFTVMAQELQSSLQPNEKGEFPMELKLKKLRTDPRITMYLLPLPKSSAAASKDTEKQASSSTPPTRTSQAASTRPAKRTKVSAKAKAMCPQELKVYPQKDPSGQAICWAFNLKSGCKAEVTNGRCKKGVHCCIKCHRSNHSLVTCRVN